MKSLLFGKEDDEGDIPGTACRNTSGILCIDCSGCDRRPDVCDVSCLTCITGAVHTHGASERIRMSSERDIEISGKASEAVCLLADVLHTPVCDPKSPDCEGCERRPTAVYKVLWSTFPEPSFPNARQMVRRGPNDDQNCTACLQRTSSLLDVSEKQMERVRACLQGGRR